MSGNPKEWALYSSYTCAMNMTTVRRYGTIILCGSIGAWRVVNHQRTNPPVNSGTYARANVRTNRYSTRNHVATNKGICRIGCAVVLLAVFTGSSTALSPASNPTTRDQ